MIDWPHVLAMTLCYALGYLVGRVLPRG